MKLKVFLGFAVLTILIVVYNSTVNWLLPLDEWSEMRRWMLLAWGDILIGCTLAILFSRYLTRDILQLVESSAIVSGGNLAHRVAITSSDEVGELARSFNTMVGSLTKVVHQTKMTANEIYVAAEQLSSTTSEVNSSIAGISRSAQTIARGAEGQAAMADSALSQTRDLAGLIGEVSSQADDAALAAADAEKAIDSLRRHTDSVNESFATVVTRVGQTGNEVNGFREKASEIGTTVARISEIAQETHILALNASIEAAKAGEHGRGFQVVAEEVRRLADSVQEFARGISATADEIQSSADSVLTSVETSSEAARQGLKKVAETHGATEAIAGSFLAIVAGTREISLATAEQTSKAARVVASIEEIVALASNNATATDEASDAAEEQSYAMGELSTATRELSQTAVHLRELVGVFTLPRELDRPARSRPEPAKPVENNIVLELVPAAVGSDDE